MIAGLNVHIASTKFSFTPLFALLQSMRSKWKWITQWDICLFYISDSWVFFTGRAWEAESVHRWHQ